ncbi:hypothetical protein LPB87_09810 [Flavobacterium sp. EDS]|uniref:ABC-three component system middle component 2 n=1 Tax=Flavobacterium sp. EDS TaxID=2897328 RepID=UPI001E3A2878|nr:ABC-three component system middle component 2 [Flavobacterium sp. EDS]MCD0474683.1 hypothetical protein [Flavobacterium sp. EDS]
MNNYIIHPFNNKIETGLRILSVLNATYPRSYDLQSMVYLDYLTVHSGDFDFKMTSLHPSVQNRKGELLVRREMILSSIDLFIEKGLIEKLYTDQGIEFIASDQSTTFLDTLSEEYLLNLQIRSIWVNEYLENLNSKTLKEIMMNFVKKGNNNLDII